MRKAYDLYIAGRSGSYLKDWMVKRCVSDKSNGKREKPKPWVTEPGQVSALDANTMKKLEEALIQGIGQPDFFTSETNSGCVMHKKAAGQKQYVSQTCSTNSQILQRNMKNLREDRRRSKGHSGYPVIIGSATGAEIGAVFKPTKRCKGRSDCAPRERCEARQYGEYCDNDKSCPTGDVCYKTCLQHPWFKKNPGTTCSKTGSPNFAKREVGRCKPKSINWKEKFCQATKLSSHAAHQMASCCDWINSNLVPDAYYFWIESKFTASWIGNPPLCIGVKVTKGKKITGHTTLTTIDQSRPNHRCGLLRTIALRTKQLRAQGMKNGAYSRDFMALADSEYRGSYLSRARLDFVARKAVSDFRFQLAAGTLSTWDPLKEYQKKRAQLACLTRRRRGSPPWFKERCPP